MRTFAVGLTVLVGTALATPVVGEDMTGQIQEEEQPGSEFELDIDDDGKAQFGRKGELESEESGPGEGGGGDPLEIGESDTPLQPLPGPADPVDLDPIDEELPGEGPDDEDPLPY